MFNENTYTVLRLFTVHNNQCVLRTINYPDGFMFFKFFSELRGTRDVYLISSLIFLTITRRKRKLNLDVWDLNEQFVTLKPNNNINDFKKTRR